MMLLWTIGEYKHNMNALRTGQGKLHVNRFSKNDYNSQTLICIPAKFAVCEFCRKWYMKTRILDHYNVCQVKKVYKQLNLEKFCEAVDSASVTPPTGTSHRILQREMT